jgi:serine/threonine-protein kinase
MNEQRQQPLIHGSYRICQRLGKGGEAEVYLVEYLPTEQLRAAKVIYTEHPKRQMHELNMMKHLHHRALPQIIDIFRVDGQVWLIMEYIRGRSLTEAVRQGLGEEQLFQIACELAEVLIYLHSRERPIYHLDIKPSNILLKRDGHLVLLDFGAAIRPDMEMGLQQFGTPGFAAPEQQNAPGTALDARADIYGFGATLYYCLHGAVPGDRSAVRNAKGRTWQHPLDQILAKCLQERKEDRYPTAESLYQDLCRLRRSAGRRKKRRAAAFAVLFFLVVVLFSAVMLSQKEESEEITPKERYDQLLKQAEGLGLSQAVPYYEKAALLQMTGDWSLELLDRMMEDYLFTAEEERVLTTLLYLSDGETGRTVSETMQEKPALYGSFAYRLGLAYWYFYEESGGRSAAASWFARAVDSQENGSVETEAAAEFSGDQIAAEDKESRYSRNRKPCRQGNRYSSKKRKPSGWKCRQKR